MSQGGTRSGGRGPRGRVFFEIQVHPADVRLPVSYYYVTPRTVVGYALAALAFLALAAMPVVSSPRLVGGLLSSREKRELRAEQGQLGTRLKALVQRLEELNPRGRLLRSEVQKLLVAYGLPIAEPEVPAPPPAAATSELAERARIERGQALVVSITRELDLVSQLAEQVDFFQQTYPERVRQTPSVRPLPADRFVLTASFGQRLNPFTQRLEPHAGVDLTSLEGTPVYATADGTVIFADRFPPGSNGNWWRLGNLVAIRHGDLFLTLYGHCAELLVKRGQRVRRGEQIATVGKTGWTPSSRLHYEIRRFSPGGGFEPVDPRLFILEQDWGDIGALLKEAKAQGQRSFDRLPPALAN